jgi:hypothetical protein
VSESRTAELIREDIRPSTRDTFGRDESLAGGAFARVYARRFFFA